MVACNEHREGLRLLALKRRLAEERLTPQEREALAAEAARLEKNLKMD
jgi:hypothetical protein